ncbi:YebC/PmpR family DNA-binding transcriptional regulator [Microcoleus sp.]|uniref:YebC/PmpR family DNA-binding transcriptional regulator n=1 Tax=Microcoleus sp. TaxID=44472 RepID=UPI0035244B5F
MQFCRRKLAGFPVLLEIDNAEKARSLLKLMDALEDLDDVQSVTANFEMTEELMLLTVDS